MGPCAVSIECSNEIELVTLLKFFYEMKFSFTIQNYDNFKNILFNAICADMINPCWIRSSNVRTVLKNIESEMEARAKITEDSNIKEKLLKIQEFVRKVEYSIENKDMNCLRKPTDHFKEFCGPMWLTRNGLISENEAIEFLRYNIKKHNMEEKDGIVKINEWMRSLLQEHRYEIYIEELPLFVERFFT